MLRRVGRLSRLLGARRGLGSPATTKGPTITSAVGMHEPSTTTTIRLSRLAPGVTETKLKDALVAAKVDSRRVLLEPGCALLFHNEAEADAATKVIIQKLVGSQCEVKPTTMPALLLHNLPESASVQSLEAAFSGHGPKSIQIVGGATLRATFKSAESALNASGIAEKIAVDQQQLKTRITKLSDSNFLLEVTNVPAASDLSKLSAQLGEALAVLSPSLITNTPATSSTATVRFAATSSSLAGSAASSSVSKQLAAAGLQSIAKVTGVRHIKKPCLSIRRVSDPALLRSLLGAENMPIPRRVQIAPRGKDTVEDTAIVYYASEEDAFAALARLRGTQLGSRRLGASYRELVEPVVVVSGLQAGIKESQVRDLFSAFSVDRVSVRPASAGGGSEAIVALASPKEVKLACAAISGRGLTVTASSQEGCDVGVDIALTAGSEKEVERVWPALATSGSNASLSVSVRSHRQAFLGFETSAAAVAALEAFLSGKAPLSSAPVSAGVTGGLVTSQLSVLPSFALEVSGLGVDSSVADLVSHLTASSALVPFRSDRAAVLKFRRHKLVVPALKQLRALKIDSQPVRAERYRPVVPIGDSDYDRVVTTRQVGAGGGDLMMIGEAMGAGVGKDDQGEHDEGEEQGMSDEALDRFSLRAVLKDYMYTDPGLRWQIARNAFERALVDAKALKDIRFLLTDGASPAMKAEATSLLNQGSQMTKASQSRLFELYLQREDLTAFTADFREMEALLGQPDEKDAFDWSQWRVEDGDDVERLQRELLLAEEQAEMGGVAGGARIGYKGREKKSKETSTLPDGKLIVVESDEPGAEPVKVSLEDPTALIDKDGRMWSGAILDTDMVQKTMPGNRVNTHRALVVVGNMRGAAGYGMGKGKTTADACNAAFR